MAKTRLFNVVGRDDFEGVTFASCTTLDKAKKAKEILESEGFEDMLEIVQDNLLIDTIELDGQIIEL